MDTMNGIITKMKVDDFSLESKQEEKRWNDPEKLEELKKNRRIKCNTKRNIYRRHSSF